MCIWVPTSSISSSTSQKMPRMSKRIMSSMCSILTGAVNGLCRGASSGALLPRLPLGLPPLDVEDVDDRSAEDGLGVAS